MLIWDSLQALLETKSSNLLLQFQTCPDNLLRMPLTVCSHHSWSQRGNRKGDGDSICEVEPQAYLGKFLLAENQALV
jgi:hypothetical protein